MTTFDRLRRHWPRLGRRPARVLAALGALALGIVLLSGSGAAPYDTAAGLPVQPSSRAATSTGNPPVASGLQRVGVIRISDLS